MKEIYFIVDPILRGSRLQLTYYFIKSLCSKVDEVVLVTRNDFLNSHFQELIGDNFPNLKIYTVDVNLYGAWTKVLNLKEFKKYVLILEKITFDFSKFSKLNIFFPALDDYFLSISYFRKRLEKLPARLIFLRYRTSFILKKPSNLKEYLKKKLQTVILKRICKSKDLLFVMDERLNGKKHFFNFCDVEFLPEPWEGSFGKQDILDSKKLLSISENNFVFLSIGKQTKRKGLLQILKAILVDPTILDNSEFLIIGKIEEDIRKVVLELLNELPNEKVILKEIFVNEKELPHYYTACDCILLPYTSDFEFTSGVLTRAAATRVPVITTDHGVIGFRVNQNNLGLTFPDNDIISFSSCLKKMINDGQKMRKTLNKKKMENIENGEISVFTEIFYNKIKSKSV